MAMMPLESASRPRFSAPPLEEAADVAGLDQMCTQQRPAPASARSEAQNDEGAEHGGLRDEALPFDDDGARPVGQPVQAGGDAEDDQQEGR